MSELKKEYPEGLSGIEMMLVRMMTEKRSWNDYRDISTALWQIQFTARNMQKEQAHLFPDSSSQEAGTV